MTAVVDASVVVAYLLGDGDVVEADAMRGEAHAPALIDVEVTQTMRGLVRARKVGLERAEASRTDLADLRIRRFPDSTLLGRAWALRDICTVYDGLYVALAEQLEAPLVTRDARLARGLRSAAVACAVHITG